MNLKTNLVSFSYQFKLSSVGLGATLNVAKPKKGSTVAIFGFGAVGLAVSLPFLVKQEALFEILCCLC